MKFRSLLQNLTNSRSLQAAQSNCTFHVLSNLQPRLRHSNSCHHSQPSTSRIKRLLSSYTYPREEKNPQGAEMSPASKIAVLVIVLTVLLCVLAYYARNQIHTFSKILAIHRSRKKEAETTAETTDVATV